MLKAGHHNHRNGDDILNGDCCGVSFVLLLFDTGDCECGISCKVGIIRQGVTNNTLFFIIELVLSCAFITTCGKEKD